MKVFISLCLALFSFSGFAQRAKLTLKAGHGGTDEFQKLSPDNRYMVFTDGNNVAILWDVASSSQVGKFENAVAADFNADGKTLYIVNDKGKTAQYSLLGQLTANMPASANTKRGKATGCICILLCRPWLYKPRQ